MSYNDQDTYHLLIWINHQSKVRGNINHIYCFNQIYHFNILSQILLQIHPQFFSDILSSAYTFQQYFSKIQQYLLQFEDLVIKKAYKKILLEHQLTSQIIKLILFILIKSKSKQEYINRILLLQEQTQVYLMNQLKKMQKNLQCKTNIKDIITQLQSLQGQNQLLNKRLKEQNDKYANITLEYNIKMDENMRLDQKNRSNLHQKINVMEFLNVTCVNKDYWQIYEDIYKQNQQITQQYSNLQQILMNTEQQNKDIQEKLQEDSYIIQHLNEELHKFRSIYNQLINQREDKEEPVVVNEIEKQNFMPKHKSKERIMNDSMLQKSIMGHLCLSQYQSPNSSFWENQFNLVNVLPFPPLQINQQIDEFKTKISSLDDQINKLKQLTQKVMKRNHHNQRTISLLKSQYQQFHLDYQFYISG